MNSSISQRARQALKHTKISADGEPLIVYRGEHGPRQVGDTGFRTALGSLSFGTLNAAREYSQSPNNKLLAGGLAVNPIVHAVCLNVQNPLLTEDKTDPFIDAFILVEHFGLAVTQKLCLQHSHYIENTDNWSSLSEEYGLEDVSDLIEKQPHLIGQLYFEVYLLLDDPAFVDMARKAGFDGAIYGGSGFTAGEAEYRVFSPEQVICPKTGNTYNPVFNHAKQLNKRSEAELEPG